MQYETIILELMSRIKVLEADTANMKERMQSLERSVNRMSAQNSNPSSEEIPAADEQRSSSYTKMTDQMIDVCYAYGKKAYQNSGMGMGDLADAAANETGMNRNSAFMYIWAVKSMLEGAVFKRAISTKALKKYFAEISNEFGKSGLENAINATRKHVAYRKSCGHTVDSIDKICDEFQKSL